ncbi:T9SS type A sorting domain-containing protein [candidate division KSB1 bacterium]|nr:T9SS type A sorting domain-containing protein [candidate division KSB1 bacterium]
MIHPIPVRLFYIFSIIILFVNSLFPAPPEARPTFHCIGLYWSTEEGTADNSCEVFYRRAGKLEWNRALDLWFDGQPHNGAGGHTNEYRGSIVNLYPGTTYEIKLKMKSGTEESLEVSTWHEDFKISKIVTLDAGQVNEELRIQEGGSEQDGYVLYTSPEGQQTVIDVKNEKSHCIRIEASWVIVRGLFLCGAEQHGIRLYDVNNVVIEDCDISGWGRSKTNGWGENFDSAIYSSSSKLEKIIIQRNKIHNPRSDANSWEENDHPEGPQGITFVGGKGYYVIRYNEIWGDKDHYYNDSMGEYHNFSYAGFPNRDSDIYCNKISHCWDDAIEAEGANMNVRIWSNLLDSTYMALGLATTSLGPNYIFRNVSFFSQRAPEPVNKYTRNGGFAKLGYDDQEYTRGKMYFFHNTVAQPPSPWGQSNIVTNGCEAGFITTGTTKHQINIYGRNNILHVNNYTRDKDSIRMTDLVTSNDFDYDIYNGKIPDIEGIEAHGIQLGLQEGPAYDPLNKNYEFFLEPGTFGCDEGVPIYNFNEYYEGTGPDIGAYENNRPGLVWGVKADWTACLEQTDVSVSQKINVPHKFEMSIFPNPFNNQTVITVRLSKPGDVELTIFDVLGRKVFALNRKQQNAGIFQMVWNAAQNASGTYFVRVESAQNVQIKKCLLLK